MKNVLVVMPFEERHKTYMEGIAENCAFRYSAVKTVTEEEVCAADAIIGNAPPALVAKAEHLAWLQLNSAGADAYCVPGILKPGTTLTCATGAYGLAVSEHLLALTLMLCRKFDLYAADQAKHRWQAEGKITSVWNSTALVLGLGDIGSEYARRMKALGSHVIGMKRSAGKVPDCVDELCTTEQLDAFLPRADFVVITLPGGPQTYHLMDERRLRLMKPGSYLINGGRGSVVDCGALNEVLRSGGPLAGCALDVTEPEPLPADHPLWDAPRAVITPHVAGNFWLQETFERIVRIAGENLRHFSDGDFAGMRNVIDPATGSRKK